MSNHDEYKVGYGKPPEHSRFKKGQSGNPKGRRKKERSLSDIETGLTNALSETATVTENGKRRQITKFDAWCKQISNKAASGSISASRLILPVLIRMAQQNLHKVAPEATAEDNSGYEKLCEMLRLPPEPATEDTPTKPTEDEGEQ